MDKKTTKHPFRRAVLRGLGVVLPPLLTIVFFLWLWNSVQSYILQPLGWATGAVIYLAIEEVHNEVPPQAKAVPPAPNNAHLLEGKSVFLYEGKRYVSLPSGQLIPANVYRQVMQDPGETIPTTAESAYKRYIETNYLTPRLIIPLFFCVFVLFLYLLGKFIAASVGRIILANVEQIIGRVPIISTVYGAVKQVTDLIFSDREIEYTRVVAIEYPRKGLWSLGFVTGESMVSLRNAAAEPVLSVLMPTSPMPATGFTVTVRRSETVDLGISVDQAFQFIVSCGVVVPISQQTKDVQEELQALVQQQIAESN